MRKEYQFHSSNVCPCCPSHILTIDANKSCCHLGDLRTWDQSVGFHWSGTNVLVIIIDHLNGFDFIWIQAYSSYQITILRSSTLIFNTTINGDIWLFIGNRRSCPQKPPSIWVLAIWKSSSDRLHSLLTIWYHPHCLTFANHNAATLATPPTFCSMHNFRDLPQWTHLIRVTPIAKQENGTPIVC